MVKNREKTRFSFHLVFYYFFRCWTHLLRTREKEKLFIQCHSLSLSSLGFSMYELWMNIIGPSNIRWYTYCVLCVFVYVSSSFLISTYVFITIFTLKMENVYRYIQTFAKLKRFLALCRLNVDLSYHGVPRGHQQQNRFCCMCVNCIQQHHPVS